MKCVFIYAKVKISLFLSDKKKSASFISIPDTYEISRGDVTVAKLSKIFSDGASRGELSRDRESDPTKAHFYYLINTLILKKPEREAMARL